MDLSFVLTRLLARVGLGRLIPSVRRWLPESGDFLHYYSNRLLAAPLDGLIRTAVALEPTGPDIIDLALAAPRLDLVPSSSTKLPVGLRGYPPANGLLELRERLAERHHTTGGRPLDADEVLVTAGASGALLAVADALIDPGTRVVVFDPCSPLFDLTLRSRRARVRRLPSWVEDGHTRFDPQQLPMVLRGARLLLLADPENPTGATLAPEDRELIAWWAKKSDVLVYVDTSFSRFHYGSTDPCPGLDTFPEAARRVLTAGSLAGGWGLASARIGWLTGHRHLVAACGVAAALANPFLPTVSQQIALSALRQGDGAFAPVANEFSARRRYLLERLRGLGLHPIEPAGGYFVWLPVTSLGLTGEAFAHELLEGHGVRVTPGSIFGSSGTGYVRLSFAADDGRVREGLSRLAAFVAERRPPANLVEDEAEVVVESGA